MYCPRCAAQNLDDARFCRACGADIRLVPQALRGSLPAAPEQTRAGDIERAGSRRVPARTDEGVRDIFKGLGFLCVFIIGMLLFRGAFWWTIWFVVPAFRNIGGGIGEIIRAREERQQLTPTPSPAYASANVRPLSVSGASGYTELSSPDTAELVNAPPSVTEMTTRHLDAPGVERGVRDI